VLVEVLETDWEEILKLNSLFALFSMYSLFALPVQANGRFIARVGGGLPIAQIVCALLGCSVGPNLDGSNGQVFLLTNSNPSIPDSAFLTSLLSQVGIIDAEPDLLAITAQSSNAVPPALTQTSPVSYFGQTVPYGYVNQPANQIIGLASAQSALNASGNGVVVAVIDTGIDPNHPALRNSLVPGYDFTRNQDGEGDETADVTLFSTPQATTSPAWVSPTQPALVDQSTAAVVDGNPGYSDFGHGTMVAGIVHVVAPGSLLMPLKAFSSNGTGYTSDIIQAIYWAINHRANVINMSFSLPGYSVETGNALLLANLSGIISVASAGNSGQAVQSYPAAYSTVIGVASTNNYDQRSTFSNYGQDVWIAAPGEGVITTYPFGTYAAGWGTSFSTPYVAGVAALMLDSQGSLLRQLLIALDQSASAQGLAHAKQMSPALGKGRLQVFQAVQAWRSALLGLFL
jgi:subtilisin family serine protease